MFFCAPQASRRRALWKPTAVLKGGDEMLYNNTDGIIALASLVKKYVKSVFGADSPQSRQLTALTFRKP